MRARAPWRALGAIAIAVLGWVAFTACRPKVTGRAKVVVSIFPVYDLVRRVAGPDADVVLLFPPGRSGPSFEPTPQDVEKVGSARLGVMVGLGFDGWMERMLKDAAPSARVLKVGDRVPTLNVKEEAGGAVDPYVWLDPQRAMVMTKAIAEELARVDPGHAGGYRVRAEGVNDALHALDQEVEAQTTAFKTREFATFHGSFRYFADRYHLQIVAVIEPMLGSTPTLDPLGGDPVTDSYEKLIRFDVAALAKALR